MIRLFRQHQGFSLPELMMAVTIAGAITTLLASSWLTTIRFSERLKDRQTTRSDIADRLRLQRFLSSAFAPETVFDDAVFELQTGHSEEFLMMLKTWTSPGGFDVPNAGTDPCQLIITADVTGGLTMSILPEYFDLSASADPDYDQSFFAHYGQSIIDVLGCDGQWHSDWPVSGHSGLPSAVRFRFVSAEFPEILIVLPAAGKCLQTDL